MKDEGMKNLIIIGNGGHGNVIKDIIESSSNFNLFAVLDDKIKKTYEQEETVYSNIMYLNTLNKEDYYFCIAIGDNSVRKKIYENLKIPIDRYITLVHPSAILSESVIIGHGTVIMPNVVVNSNTRIGHHCIINTASIIEHDNQIGNYAHISPSATLAGTVVIEEGVHIGINAAIIPNKKIGEWSIIGAGSVVINDIEALGTFIGIPARKKEKGDTDGKV